MGYVPYTKEQKQEYAKKFTPEERAAYLKGKRLGFLEGVHKQPVQKKSDFVSHSKEELLADNLFDDLDKIDLFKQR